MCKFLFTKAEDEFSFPLALFFPPVFNLFSSFYYQLLLIIFLHSFTDSLDWHFPVYFLLIIASFFLAFLASSIVYTQPSINYLPLYYLFTVLCLLSSDCCLLLPCLFPCLSCLLPLFFALLTLPICCPLPILLSLVNLGCTTCSTILKLLICHSSQICNAKNFDTLQNNYHAFSWSIFIYNFVKQNPL